MTNKTNRIVLADGNPAIRSAMALLLETRLKVRVVAEADNMESLLTALVVTQPDILILDWDLPGVPKENRIATLRAFHSPMKVVVTSSRQENCELAMACQADSYVCKSEPPEQVVHVIQTL